MDTARPEDLTDLQALAAHLGLRHADDVLAVVARFVPPRLRTPRTQYLIETLFSGEEAEDDG